MPWREEKKQKYNKLIFIYIFIFIIIILILIKNMFFIKLDNIKNNINNINIKNYNKTLFLVNFLYNMPSIIKSDLFLNKISINNDFIKINISTNNISNIEKFVQKIKNQNGVKKINIDSGESLSGYKNENKDNKFIFTVYPLLFYNINKLNNTKYNTNKIISKIYKISSSTGVHSDVYISNFIYVKSIGNYKNLIELLINITKEFKNLIIFSLSIYSENIEDEYNGDLNMNVVFRMN